MNGIDRRALVPFIPGTFEDPEKNRDRVAPESGLPVLVEQVAHLNSNEDIKKYLPDILGRALAHMWIDESFRLRFAGNPKQTLEALGVFLPSSILVDYVQMARSRPQVVVYHCTGDGRFKTRLLYLQLVMMAGK